MTSEIMNKKIDEAAHAKHADDAILVKKNRIIKSSNAADKEGRVSCQPGFVLHSYPYKETSLVIDFFSRDYGRIGLIAKGAKRPHSALRGVLQTFQPLSVSWSGKSELRTMVAAEWVGGLLPLEKSALLCGFYLNELLIKLVARDDTHTKLFDHYVSTLNQLAHGELASTVLRRFEHALLKEVGVAADFSFCTSTKNKVLADQYYVVDPLSGVRIASAREHLPQVLGSVLLAVEAGDYTNSETQAQSKFVMRALLSHHLGGVKLNTRQILVDLMQL